MLHGLQEYRAGRLLTGELKGKCIKVLQDFVKGFQDVRLRSCRRRGQHDTDSSLTEGESEGHGGRHQGVHGQQQTDRPDDGQEQRGACASPRGCSACSPVKGYFLE